MLLKLGADINHQEKQKGYTPLHNAAAGFKIKNIKLLVQMGARTDLNASIKTGPEPSTLVGNHHSLE